MEIKVKIWIEDNKQNLIFGSGKTEILKEIEKLNSIGFEILGFKVFETERPPKPKIIK